MSFGGIFISQNPYFFARQALLSSINPNPFFIRRGFEPLSKSPANHSCVPLVASGIAERAEDLTRKSQKPTTF